MHKPPRGGCLSEESKSSCDWHSFILILFVFSPSHPSVCSISPAQCGLHINGDSMFGGDDISGSSQVHEHGAQVRKRRCGANIKPVGERRRVPQRTHPQATAHSVPHVVRSHGNEEHPRQRAPGVFEASEPHEEAQGQTQDGDEGGAVEGRTLRERGGGLRDKKNCL